MKRLYYYMPKLAQFFCGIEQKGGTICGFPDDIEEFMNGEEKQEKTTVSTPYHKIGEKGGLNFDG